MGRQRQKLWSLEHWFDNLFLLINKTSSDMEKPETTVEELGQRFSDFWMLNMRSFNTALASKVGKKKPVAKPASKKRKKG